jgi:hypothetical protein
MVQPVPENYHHYTPLPLHKKSHPKLLMILFTFLVFIVSVLSFLFLKPSARRTIIKNSPFKKFLMLNKNKNLPFKLVESSPENFDDNFPIFGQPTFVFSKEIGTKENELSKYLQISPRIDGQWRLENNGQVIYFSANKKGSDTFPPLFNYNSFYQITIKKELRSSDGQNLSEDVILKFRSTTNNKSILDSEKKLYSSYVGQKTKITFYSSGDPNINWQNVDVKIAIKSASEDQLLNYFSYIENKNPLFYFSSNGNEKTIATFNSQIKRDQKGLFLEVPALDKPGLYYVKVNKNQDEEDFFVTVSKHINQVFADSSDLYVWVTDNEKGKSLSGYKVDFYTLKNSPKLINSSATDEKGLSHITNRDTSIDLVITKNSEDIAISKTYQYDTKTGNNYQIFSYVDRPVYRPGDVIHYKAIIRQKENGTLKVPSGKVYAKLQINNLLNQSKNYQELLIDENGSIIGDFNLPPQVNSGYVYIALAQKNRDSYQNINLLEVKVESYRKPDLDITAYTVEKEYISKDTAHFTVLAKSLYDKPMANVDFSYRVLVNNYSEIRDRNLENIDSSANDYYGGGEELTSGQGKFDNQGKAKIEFSTDLFKFEESQILMLEITPNIGVSPSIGKIARLIHRGEYGIFIDEIKGSIEKGVEGNLLILDHNNPRAPVKVQSTDVLLNKLIMPTNEKELLSTKTATSSADGKINFIFENLKGSGQYELIFKGKDKRDNTITAKYQLYIGKETVSSPTEKPQYTLEIKKDRNLYKPGETANITLSSNFQIEDIVSVQASSNNGNYFYYNVPQILSLDKSQVGKNNWITSILVDRNATQNIGFSVFATYDNNVIFNTISIDVDVKEKQLVTNISFDKTILKPKDKVNVELTTKDSIGNPVSADNSLVLIDAAILQIGKLNEDIYGSFYNNQLAGFVTAFDSTVGIYKNRGGGGGGCFLEGTKILMKDKKLTNIEKIKTGDVILTRSSDFFNQLVEDVVVKTFRHIVNEYIVINNSLNVTPIHRIYLNRRWQTAAETKIGDILIDDKGNEVKITSIKRQIGQFVVYNLQTAKQHTFFADGFYVHNEKGVGPRQNFADTAYWNPHIRTDQNGKAKVRIQLPDNITTFTANVISQTNDSKFGQTTAEIISKRDLVIIPALANFYYQGDKPIISTLVQNNSDNDLNAELSLTIKETNFKDQKAIKIAKDDFEQIGFLVELKTTSPQLSFLFELKEAGKDVILDSVLIKKPVFPQGDIQSSWYSFEGSKTFEFSPKYKADFNNLSIYSEPHLASWLTVKNFIRNNFYLEGEPSSYLGSKLNTASFLLSQTRDGNIDPSIYQYALLKNNFRAVINDLIDKRIESGPDSYYWQTNNMQEGDSPQLMTVWIIKAIKETAKAHLLDEIGNITVFLNKNYHYEWRPISEPIPPPLPISVPPTPAPTSMPVVERSQTGLKPASKQDLSLPSPPININVPPPIGDLDVVNEEKIISDWTSGKLEKELNVLSLTKKALLTATDRYIWENRFKYLKSLWAFMMIEKGGRSDQEKTVKGLSFQYGANSYDYSFPLAFLAALKHAVNNNLEIGKVSYKVVANNETVYDTEELTDEGNSNSFSYQFFLNNIPNNKLKINIEKKAGLPIYSTIVMNNYSASIDNNSLSIDLKNVSQGQLINGGLERKLKSIENGESIPEPSVGKTYLIELSLQSPVSSPSNNYYSYVTTFKAQDALSPAVMILNQISGNSPQYQSTLGRFYLTLGTDYFLPSDYSGQFVSFDGEVKIDRIYLPYVVYKITDGEYYHPKTSLIFPKLGIIVREK